MGSAHCRSSSIRTNGRRAAILRKQVGRRFEREEPLGRVVGIGRRGVVGDTRRERRTDPRQLAPTARDVLGQVSIGACSTHAESTVRNGWSDTADSSQLP